MKESKECLGCIPQCKQRPVQWAELNSLQGFELSKDITMCVSIGLQQNWINTRVRGVVVFMCFSSIYGGMGHCQLLEGLVPSSLWKPLGPRLARAADTRVMPLSCVKSGDFFPYPKECFVSGVFNRRDIRFLRWLWKSHPQLPLGPLMNPFKGWWIATRGGVIFAHDRTVFSGHMAIWR